MMKAVNPYLTVDQIEDILNKTAVDVMEKGRDEGTGYGVVDSRAAVDMAQNFKTQN